MTSQPGKRTIVTHILPSILKNKDNQAIKFGQLRECNKKHFPWKTIYKMWWVNWSEKLKLSVSLDQQHEFLFSSFKR